MNFRKNSKGITLIILVVTIIVLLILAGVSLSLIAGGDGILERAETSTKEYRISAARELLDLKLAEIDMDSYEINLKKATFVEIVEEMTKATDFFIKEFNLGQVTAIKPPSDLSEVNSIFVYSEDYTDIVFEITNEREIKLCDVEDEEIPENKPDPEPENQIAVEVSVVDASGNEISKLTEGTQIRVVETSNASEAQSLSIKMGNTEIYSEELSIENDTAVQNISLDSMKNLSSINFYDSYDITAEITSKNNQKTTASKSGIVDYTIGSANDLNKLATLVNSGTTFEGETILQIADVELDSEKSISIGSEKAFKGTYNGDEKIIKGIKINASANNQGLFGYIENATISNIILDGGEIVGTYNVGGIVGYNNGGTIDNCEVKNLSVSATGYVQKTYKFVNDWTGEYANVGGIVGYNYNGNINNCSNKSANVSGKYSAIGGIIGNDDGTNERVISSCKNLTNITGSNYYAIGGIIGQSYNLATIKNCENNGNISGYNIDVSGICGVITNGNIEECKNTGNITGTSNIGGICGEIERINETTVSNVSKCSNEGTITSTGYYTITIFYDNANHEESQSIAGGIVGLNSTGNIYESKNKGQVKSTQSGLVEIGGIVGVSKNGGTISKCANIVGIESNTSTDCVGGIAGYTNQITIEECYNVGDIQGNGNNAGGIAGGTTYTTIKNCYNTASISSNTNAGGIIGLVVPYKTSLDYEYLYNCYNIGETNGASGYTDPLVGHTRYLTYDYIYTLKSVHKSDGTWQNSYDGKFEAIDDTTLSSNEVKAKMLTSLLNGNGQNKWTRDTTGTINDGYPYLVNNKPE